MPTLPLAIDASKARAGAAEFERAASRAERAAIRASFGVGTLDKATGVFGRTALTVRSQLAPLIGGIGTLLTAVGGLKAISDFETGLVGVGKVSGIAGEELRALGESFVALSGQVPVTAKELEAIAQEVVRLGVTGSDNIRAFTRTIAELGSTSDLKGGEAATTLARLLTVAGESASEVETLGSVVVRLGGAFAASESEIARVALQVSQNTAAFKVSSAQAVALGAAMKALGIEAQVAGSSVGKSFVAIDNAIREGGRKLEGFALIAGKSKEEFAALFKRDQTAGFQAFVEGLDRVAKSGGSVNAVLSELGLDDIRVQRVLGALSKRSDELGRALSTANDELEDTSALTARAALQFDTIAGQAGLLKNAVVAVALSFKDVGGPFKEFLSNVRGGIAVIAGLDDTFKEGAPLAREYAAAIGALAGAAAFGKLSSIIPGILTGLKGIALAAKANPFLALASAAATLAGAIFAVRNETVTLGDSTAQVSDFVSAAFSVLGERVSVIFRALQILVRTSLDFWRDKTKEVVDSIGGFFSGFFSDFDVNWSKVFDRALEIGKYFANATIGLFLGVGESLVKLVGKLDEFVVAFNAFDPSRPFESLKDIKKNVAFVGSELALDFRRAFEGKFKTDFVGRLGAQVKGALQVAKSEIEAESKIQLPESLTELFDPLKIAEEVGKRAAELKQARDKVVADSFKDALGGQNKVSEFVSSAALLPFIRLAPQAAAGAKSARAEVDGLGAAFDESGESADAFWQSILDGQEEAAKALKSTADDIGKSFGDAFESIIFDQISLKEATKQLVREVTQELFRLYVTRQIVSGVSNFVGGFLPTPATNSAMGNAFVDGRKTINFARGGIFERETTMRGAGNTKLRFAEVGKPEGAFPLTRDSRGNLAVSAVMPEQTTRNVTVVQNIQTPDLDGFRRSRRQLARQAKQDIERR